MVIKNEGLAMKAIMALLNFLVEVIILGERITTIDKGLHSFSHQTFDTGTKDQGVGGESVE